MIGRKDEKESEGERERECVSAVLGVERERE